MSTGPAEPKTVGVRIDIETRSGADLKKAGVYRYVEDPDFEVQLIACSYVREVQNGERRMLQPFLADPGNPFHAASFQKLLQDPTIEKHAFNANFERVALSRWMGMPPGEYLDPKGWYCSAVLANVYGVYGSLDEVARAVRSPIQKNPEGRRLIRLFASPDRKTGVFHDTAACWCGSDHTADFDLYGDYCKQDVRTEAVVAASFPPIPDDVQAQYEVDQRINDRGIRHFRGLSERAVEQVTAEQARLMQELRDLTGLDNPNSVQQMLRWVAEQGYPMTSLNKAARTEALADPLIPDEVAEALRLKGAASLSSVMKHKAALDTRSVDGRIRGSLRFYGAHTGREAGRGIQPQNLPRDTTCRTVANFMLNGQCGSNAPVVAKKVVRQTLVPKRGYALVVCDYNAIEARCLGWLAGERWVEAEFRGEGKIYEATAAAMFGVDKAALVAALRACGKCGSCEACNTRSKGKVANLALGYAGGAGALVTLGAEAAGIDIGNYATLHAEWERQGKPGKFHEWERDLHDYPELIRLRDLYRESSPATARFWKLCGQAWDVAALQHKGARFGQDNVLSLIRDGRHNRLVLPSGRSIWYRFARSHEEETKDGGKRVDRRTFIGKGLGVGHVWTDTHGGKLCIAGDALVLTHRGWYELRDVLPSDLVWDGVEFVAQGGRVSKGARPVINVEGVRMTPDHRIMQKGGWREAEQYDRSDWQEVGLPGGDRLRPVGAEDGWVRFEADLGGAVRVRFDTGDAEERSASGASGGRNPSEVLRVPARRADLRRHLADGRRAQQAPAVWPLAHGEVSLHPPYRSRVGALRRAWDRYVRPVAARLLGLRRGHGANLAAGADAGPDRQRRAVLPGELPLGDPSNAGAEPSGLPRGGDSVRPYASDRGEPAKRDRVHDTSVPARRDGIGGDRPETVEVYDLLNCGPRNRFTVLTANGPMLVHNCENATQAVARDVLFDLLMKIEDLTSQGWPGRTVLHVHDEVVLEVPTTQAEQVLADVLGLMAEPPDWAPGLAVKGEGGVMERYGK